MAEDPNEWELFDECFNIGDDVIVVDVFDQFYWGKLIKTTETECVVQRRARTDYLSWDDIRFMAHDGFPVKKIKGKWENLELLDNSKTMSIIRRSLDKTPHPSRTRFGDPFDITEPVTSWLYHPGNSGRKYWNRFWNEHLQQYLSPAHRTLGYETEEVIVMEAKDGACAELWDLTTILEFE